MQNAVCFGREETCSRGRRLRPALVAGGVEPGPPAEVLAKEGSASARPTTTQADPGLNAAGYNASVVS